MSTSASPVVLTDEAARRVIREQLDICVFVEASAGTGKTYELVKRIVAVIRAGGAIEKMAAVTFTHKAAGELKLRLRAELDHARGKAMGDERRSLEHALKRLEEASIGTIHSFCAELLRERPVEACVDPAFQELSEQSAPRLYRRAFQSWLEERLQEGSIALKRFFSRVPYRDPWETGSPMAQLEYAGRSLIEWRDHDALWQRPEFHRETEIDELVQQVHAVARVSARARKPGDSLAVTLKPAREVSAWIERARANGDHDYDRLEAMLLKLGRDLARNPKVGRGAFADGIEREDVVRDLERLTASLFEFDRRAGADLAALLHSEMQSLVAGYEALKRASGQLDFTDLLLRARDLVRDNAAVRRYLQQERFTHIFVDEFQDTDPLQAELLLLLASDDPEQSNWREANPVPGKLFVVGDPKQSIYRFRRADVLLYADVRDRLAARGVRVVQLTHSHRALAPIQECMNAAFSGMQEDPVTGQAGYSPLTGGRESIDGQPCVVALPVPYPYATYRIAKSAINECLPDAVGAFVWWLVHESGWKVRDPAGGSDLVPVQAKHVCLLFRRFTNAGNDLTREYIRALESRGVPHVLIGSRSFHQREEVETIRTALRAIEWPGDELSVYATLRGSLFAIDDGLLLRFRAEHKRLHPLMPLAPGLDPCFEPIAEALALLAGMHRNRNRLPIASTIQSLLECTRAHAAFAFRPSGEQVLANVQRVCDLARSFESSGGVSFRGFVDELENQCERGEESESTVLEDTADGVRLMTSHRAKGLEFPVVILVDITAGLAAREPDRHVDAERRLCAQRLLRCAPIELLENQGVEHLRDEAEGVRVAYVAATRARDLLVVPAVGDEPLEGWAAPLNAAIYPARETWRRPETPPGCPQFGSSSVKSRPLQYEREGDFSVRPGLHRPSVGEHSVVWWCPNALRLGIEEVFTMRQEQLLTPNATSETPHGVDDYRAWQANLATAIAQGSTPSCTVKVMSATSSPPGFDMAIETIHIERADREPGGREFGAVVHSLLSAIDWSHPDTSGFDAAEAPTAVEAVRCALEHPFFSRVRRASVWRSEMPVMVKQDSVVWEGAADLVFLEDGVWNIVDFKTDADDQTQSRYLAQLRWYGLAVAESTKAPVQGWLVCL